VASKMIGWTTAEVALLAVLARAWSSARDGLAARVTAVVGVFSAVVRDAFLELTGTSARVSRRTRTGGTGRVVAVQTVTSVVFDLARSDDGLVPAETLKACDTHTRTIRTALRDARSKWRAQRRMSCT
jgi:hypothetical protein